MYLSTRSLKRIESRFRRDEEAFRLAHSPRVVAAIELWSSFCRFEEAIEKALYSSSFNLYEAPTVDEMVKLTEGDAHLKKATADLHAAFLELTPALAKAELLLHRVTYAACAELAKAYDSVYGEGALAKELGYAPALRHERERQRRSEVQRCRAKALAALQETIGTESMAPSTPQ
jgi:hypothetical protein